MFRILHPGTEQSWFSEVFEHRKFFGGQRDWLLRGPTVWALSDMEDKIGQLQFILGHRRPPERRKGQEPGQESENSKGLTK